MSLDLVSFVTLINGRIDVIRQGTRHDKLQFIKMTVDVVNAFTCNQNNHDDLLNEIIKRLYLIDRCLTNKQTVTFNCDKVINSDIEMILHSYNNVCVDQLIDTTFDLFDEWLDTIN